MGEVRQMSLWAIIHQQSSDTISGLILKLLLEKHAWAATKSLVSAWTTELGGRLVGNQVMKLSIAFTFGACSIRCCL